MHKMPVLVAGDSVEIIAPASRCSDQHLLQLKELLASWQLNCIVADDIFGKDLLCANTDEIRFKSLRNAIENSQTKAIICARGGYGSMRLIPELTKVSPPQQSKLFVGMSDLTALNLYLHQQWGWPILHGALAIDKFSPESIAAFKSVLFGETDQLKLSGIPLNSLAEKNHFIEANIIGGNLTLVQTGIGTPWQMNASNKIIFLEEIGERGYRIDRMLEHLRQAGAFEKAKAILLGDFINGNEPNGSSLVEPVLERFAKSCEIPVVKIEGLGHGSTNFPLPLGKTVTLQFGKEIRLN